MLQEQGCVFQERHGWERPGWFNRGGPAPVRFQHMHHSIGPKLFCVHCDTHNPLKPLRSISHDYWLICLLNWCLQLSFSQVLDYDYYGAYDVLKYTDYKYSEILGKEYTFDFPPHHDVVSMCVWEFLASSVHKNFLSEWLNRFVFSI